MVDYRNFPPGWQAEHAAEPPVDELETLGHDVTSGRQEQKDQRHSNQDVDNRSNLA